MIQLNNVYKKYGSKTILNNINLTINEGEITFIVGTSGAGKTTLLNMIGGLDRPTSGSITFNGSDIGEELNTYRANNIGFVFQDFNLVQGLTVLQNIQVATEIAGLKLTSEEIVLEVNRFGIADANQRVETLSGGEKQRVAIIRSVCKDANILIADEPTGSLDSKNADFVFGMLQNIKMNKHIIVVSHDLDKARKYADRIITIDDGKIVTNENIEEKKLSEININEKGKEVKVHKSSIFHTILTLGVNSVRRRLARIISIALVIAMSIASLTFVMNINDSGNSLSHNINVNYLENDLMELYYEVTPNAGYMEYPFTEEDISFIWNEYDIKEMVKIYLADNNDWFFTSESQTYDAKLKQININDFFEERIFSNDIEGAFLSNDNEIIIAEDVAQELYDKECIGEKITLNNGDGYSIEYTIVGVNHTKNPSDDIYSFISAESLKKVLNDIMESKLYSRQVLSTFYTEIQSMTVGGIYGSMGEVINDEELLYGRYPNSENEILISSALLVNVLGEFGVENRYSIDEITKGNIVDEDIEKILSKKFAINHNGVFEVYVSGIYLSDDLNMRFTRELINKMKKIDPINISIYVDDPNDVSRIKSNIINENSFVADIELDTLKSNITNQTKFFSLALILFGVVLLCISVALLSSFSKIVVMERKKEIAIVKSLGANNKQVLGVLMFDSIVISVIALLGSFVVYEILRKVSLNIFSSVGLVASNFPIGLLMLIGIVFSLFIFLQTSITLRKFVKIMPAQLFIQ